MNFKCSNVGYCYAWEIRWKEILRSPPYQLDSPKGTSGNIEVNRTLEEWDGQVRCPGWVLISWAYTALIYIYI